MNIARDRAAVSIDRKRHWSSSSFS
jgi:hypothetical protein